MHMRKYQHVNHHVLAVCYYNKSYQAHTSIQGCAGKAAWELNLPVSAGNSPNLQPEPRIQSYDWMWLWISDAPPLPLSTVFRWVRSDICLHIFNSVILALLWDFLSSFTYMRQETFLQIWSHKFQQVNHLISYETATKLIKDIYVFTSLISDQITKLEVISFNQYCANSNNSQILHPLTFTPLLLDIQNAEW